MTSMKIVLFLRHPTILVHLRVKFFHSPDLRRPVSSEILTDAANHDQLNQLIKKNIIQWGLLYVIRSFRSAFAFSINSLILSGFPLTSYHLAEPSLSAFSWLYALVCAVLRIITKCLLFKIIQIFGTCFATNLFYLHNLKT